MAFRPGTLFEGSGMGDLVKRTQGNLNRQTIFDQPNPFRRQAEQAGGTTASPVTINLGTGGQAQNIPPLTPGAPPGLDPIGGGLGGPIGSQPTATEGTPPISPEQLRDTLQDMPQVVQQMLGPLLDQFFAGEIGIEAINELVTALGVPNPTASGAAARELSGAFAGNPFISRLGRGRMFLGNAPLFNQFRPGFFRQTSPTMASSIEGLLQSLGIPRGELEFFLNSVRPASFR